MKNCKNGCRNFSSVRPRLPEWIRVKAYRGKGRCETGKVISDLGLNTVCQSAKCPNVGECWHKRTAAFMAMGNICTRNCRFCAVTHGIPEALDSEEPGKIAQAVSKMKLKYAVITSVTRDDLDDGGAGHFAKIIDKIRQLNRKDVGIEVLTPDFQGKTESLEKIGKAKPDVFNHNIETVERLSKQIRVTADYRRSMAVLTKAAETFDQKTAVKSGLMVGLGETDDEVLKTVNDLFSAGARILTIGQYLPPTLKHWPLDRYVQPDKFEEWKNYAYEIGFTSVASAPLVRSSYQAEKLYK
ncbi:MAG: lipoyl synthase [Victivallales bacterium]|nr:lipoyl synthase [Victivallales bacterium]